MVLNFHEFREGGVLAIDGALTGVKGYGELHRGKTIFTLGTRQTMLSHHELLRSHKSQMQWLVAYFFARIKFRDVKKEVKIIK